MAAQTTMAEESPPVTRSNSRLDSFLTRTTNRSADGPERDPAVMSAAEESALEGIDYCPSVANTLNTEKSEMDDYNRAFMERVAAGVVKAERVDSVVRSRSGRKGGGGGGGAGKAPPEEENLDDTMDISCEYDCEEDEGDVVKGGNSKVEGKVESPKQRQREQQQQRQRGHVEGDKQGDDRGMVNAVLEKALQFVGVAADKINECCGGSGGGGGGRSSSSRKDPPGQFSA